MHVLSRSSGAQGFASIFKCPGPNEHFVQGREWTQTPWKGAKGEVILGEECHPPNDVGWRMNETKQMYQSSRSEDPKTSFSR